MMSARTGATTHPILPGASKAGRRWRASQPRSKRCRYAQREAFLLREEGGLTAAQIAAATGSDPEAVKSRLRYAWQKLKQATDG